MQLGPAVKSAREGRKLSHEELGQLVGCGRSQISRIESGRRVPSVSLLLKLCEELKLDANAIEIPPVRNGAREARIATDTEDDRESQAETA